MPSRRARPTPAQGRRNRPGSLRRPPRRRPTRPPAIIRSTSPPCPPSIPLRLAVTLPRFCAPVCPRNSPRRRCGGPGRVIRPFVILLALPRTSGISPTRAQFRGLARLRAARRPRCCGKPWGRLYRHRWRPRRAPVPPGRASHRQRKPMVCQTEMQATAGISFQYKSNKMLLLLQRSIPRSQQSRPVCPVDGPTAAHAPSKTTRHSLGYVFDPIASC